jgi:hypothetical protein
MLGAKLAELGFTEADIDKIVAATGPRESGYGFTYSDLAQRLIPAMVLDAYPEKAISPARALEIAEAMVPTAPFAASDS